MYRRTLSLTDVQRAELVAVRDRDPRPYLREIASALLKVADGHAAFRVAQHGLLRPRKPETLYRWLDTYEQGGLPALVHRPRGHRGFSPSRRRSARAHGAPRPAGVRSAPDPLATGRPA